MTGLLQGIRILDLADEKGSFCSKLLADLGARVIKIEKPDGDSSRKIGPFRDDLASSERSLFFSHNNTNKLGVTLNLDHPAGKDVFTKLLKGTDVVVETFPPGYLDSLGLGFKDLAKISRRLVLVSLTGFGQSGPRKGFKSCDLVASAFGGQMYVSGSPSTSPLKPFGEQSYYTASLYAAIAVLLALRKRGQTGKGEHVDLSLQEAVVSTLDHVMVRYFYENVVPQRQGSMHWNHTFCILPCKDGHILVTLFERWNTLVEWLEGEGMAEDLKDERYKEEAYRLERINHIMQVLERWTRTHTARRALRIGPAHVLPLGSGPFPRGRFR